MPDINGYWMVKSPGITSEWIYDHTCPSQFGVETKASVGFDPSPVLWSQPIEGSGPSPHRPPVLLRAVRSELCAALGSWCFADFAEMVFWHSLHYPTRRHHCQEYQRISSQTTNEMLDTFTVLCAVQTVLMHIIFPCEISFPFVHQLVPNSQAVQTRKIWLSCSKQPVWSFWAAAGSPKVPAVAPIRSALRAQRSRASNELHPYVPSGYLT